MTEELKWKEETRDYLVKLLSKGIHDCLCVQHVPVQRRVWSAKVGMYELSIIEGDLYYSAAAMVWDAMFTKTSTWAYGPDMESAKQALLVKLATQIEGQLKTLYGEITVEKQAQ